MAQTSGFITRTVPRETIEAWGLPQQHKMAKHPLCVHCGHGALWVECPTGGWWSHWVHPEDGHDAEMDSEFDDSRASFVKDEWMGSGRWCEKRAVVFRAPDDNGYWIAYYEDTSDENAGDDEPWDYAQEITLTMVSPKPVTRTEWVLTPRLASTPRP